MTSDEDAEARPAWIEGLDPIVARLEAERIEEERQQGIEPEPQEVIEAAWRAEVQRRAEELRADPSIGLTWDEVKARLTERLAEADAIRRAPGFAEEAHRQSAAVAGSPDAAKVQEWLDAIQDWPEEDES